MVSWWWLPFLFWYFLESNERWCVGCWVNHRWWISYSFTLVSKNWTLNVSPLRQARFWQAKISGGFANFPCFIYPDKFTKGLARNQVPCWVWHKLMNCVVIIMGCCNSVSEDCEPLVAVAKLLQTHLLPSHPAGVSSALAPMNSDEFHVP